mmetsp:Transcript_12741/g.19374  ORF Transcript_12741/g.19374 Transcript_12741/m.19374 type:complete len:222 (+) Transcript_12741:660-1325(+)
MRMLNVSLCFPLSSCSMFPYCDPCPKWCHLYPGNHLVTFLLTEGTEYFLHRLRSEVRGFLDFEDISSFHVLLPFPPEYVQKWRIYHRRTTYLPAHTLHHLRPQLVILAVLNLSWYAPREEYGFQILLSRALSTLLAKLWHAPLACFSWLHLMACVILQGGGSVGVSHLATYHLLSENHLYKDQTLFAPSSPQRWLQLLLSTSIDEKNGFGHPRSPPTNLVA